MLGLAASDMRQAESAARAIPGMQPVDFHLKRALQTALVVCYSRAFTMSSIVTLKRDEYEPSGERLASLHHRILALRDSTCAHTDKDVDRDVSVQYGVDDSVAVAETFGPVLSPEELELAHELFELQRQRFLEETIAIEELVA